MHVENAMFPSETALLKLPPHCHPLLATSSHLPYVLHTETPLFGLLPPSAFSFDRSFSSNPSNPLATRRWHWLSLSQHYLACHMQEK